MNENCFKIFKKVDNELSLCIYRYVICAQCIY